MREVVAQNIRGILLNDCFREGGYCSFVLFNGNRKLVKRIEFEKYLNEAHNI